MTKVTTTNKAEATQDLTKEREVAVHIWDSPQTTYIDQTGRFLFMEYNKSGYIMLLVDLNSSSIFIKALKD